MDERSRGKKDSLDWGESVTVRDHDTGTLPQVEPMRARLSASRIPLQQQPALAPGTRVGDYEIAKKFDEDAASQVYLALHPTIGRRVAIKVINPALVAEPEMKERFISEARAVAAIHHPGIVHVFGFGTHTDGRAYLVMEWLSGETLGARRRRSEIPFTDALDIILQITGALRAAHDNGVIHRHLNPENIFLQEVRDEKPLVKILDFGVAMRVDDPDDPYASPEQRQHELVDRRTDVYAFGRICHELLAGHEIPEGLAQLMSAMISHDSYRRPSLEGVRRIVHPLLHTSQVMAVVGAEPKLTFDDMTKLPLPAPAKTFPKLEAVKRQSKEEIEHSPTLEPNTASLGEASTLDGEDLLHRQVGQRTPIARWIVLGVIVFVAVISLCVVVALTQ